MKLLLHRHSIESTFEDFLPVLPPLGSKPNLASGLFGKERELGRPGVCVCVCVCVLCVCVCVCIKQEEKRPTTRGNEPYGMNTCDAVGKKERGG